MKGAIDAAGVPRQGGQRSSAPSRMCWGSNFPAAKPPLPELIAMARKAFDFLPQGDQDQIFYKTALDALSGAEQEVRENCRADPTRQDEAPHADRQLSQRDRDEGRTGEVRPDRVRLSGLPGAEPRLQADGARAQVRLRRTRDRHVPAGARASACPTCCCRRPWSAAASFTPSPTIPSAAR